MVLDIIGFPKASVKRQLSPALRALSVMSNQGCPTEAAGVSLVGR
jgi:hypothetical protein